MRDVYKNSYPLRALTAVVLNSYIAKNITV